MLAFAISNAVMVLWLNVLLCILISYLIDDWDVLLWVGVIFIYPVYLLINALRRPTRYLPASIANVESLCARQ